MRRSLQIALLMLLAGLAALVPAGTTSAATPTTATLALRSHLGGGAPRSIAALGGRLYTAFGPTLQVFDLAAPASPALSAQLTLPRAIGPIAAAGAAVYLLLDDSPGQSALVAAIDVASPSSPRLAATAQIAPSRHLLGGDGLVYAVSFGEIAIFDGADPARLQQLGTIALPERLGFAPQPVALAGRLLFVSTERELLIYTLAEPAAPRLLSRTPITGAAQGFSISVADGYAYLATSLGLQTLDVRDPAQPRGTGALTLAAYAIQILGRYAVGIAGDGLNIYDVSDRARPLLETFRRVGGTSGSSSALAVAADHAYLTSDSGVAIVRLVDPLNLVTVGQIDARPAEGSVALGAAHLYMPGQVFSLADPDRPALVGAYPGAITAVAGAFGYGAAGAFTIYSLADPAAPQLLATYSRGLNITGLALRGSYAYLSDGGVCGRGGCIQTSLHVVDIADPSQPSQVGLFGDLALRSPVIVGDYLYSIGVGGVQVIALANPAVPTRVGTVAIPSARWVAELASGDGRLYLLTSDALLIYDLAEPAAPRLVGTLEAGGFKLAVAAPYAYIEHDGLLRVVDVADPERPRLRGGYQRMIGFGGYGPLLAARGDRLYDGSRGLYSFQRVTVALTNRTYLPLVAR